MAAYISIGQRYIGHGISRTQYADSIYYLGFLFTLVSIVAAIMDVGPDADVSQVVNRFGVKLITTLIGLGARVYLVNFRPSTEDVAEGVEDALTEAARQLHDRIEVITLDLNALSSALALTLKSATQRVGTELSQTLTQANLGFQSVLGEMREGFSASLSDLQNTARQAGEGVAGSVTGTAVELDRLRDRLVAAGSEIASQAETLVHRLRAAELPPDIFVAQLLPPIQRIADSLRDPATQIGEAGTALGDASARMSEALEKAGALGDGVARLSDEISKARGMLTGLESSLGAVAARSAEATRLSDRELAQLRERGTQLAADQDLVLRLMNELHEVLESVRENRHRSVLSRILSRSKK
jgi:DNA anti-recombination protein RmuC